MRISLHPVFAMRRSACGGLAFLEAASVSVVLILLLTGAVACVQYLSVSTLVQQAVDRQVYESGVKPFRLQIRSDGAVEPQFLESEIYRRAEEIRSEILEQLRSTLPGELQRDDLFFIQTVYGTAPVDSGTGQVMSAALTVRELPHAGGLTPPPGLLAELDITSEFRARLATLRPDGSSLGAIPRGQIEGTVGEARFLPLAVLLGARVLVSVEGASLGRLLELVAMQPWLGARKVVLLRGDLGR